MPQFGILGALAYLKLTSLQGLLRSRLARLRQPKYLAGALIGVAYIYFFFLRQRGPRPGRHGGFDPQAAAPPEILPLIAAAGALLLLLIVILAWVLPRAPASLAFSEAEIAFLFPAPVARRTLIHYRLLSSSIGLGLTSLIFTLFSNRWGFLGGNAVTHALGWWLILTTISLHFTGSSFAITRLLDRGITPWYRRLIVFAIAATLAVVIAVWIGSAAAPPSTDDLASIKGLLRYGAVQLTSTPLQWLLALPRMVLAPFLAADFRAFALALAPALLILVAHYCWVLRSEARFEEASIVRAEKRTARRLAMQKGKLGDATGRKPRREPFRLSSRGRPELAFLWKNLLSTYSLLARPRVLLASAVVACAGCLWVQAQPEWRGLQILIAAIAVPIAGFLLVFGPQLARQDLRSDLPNSDILKTYPLHGWQIVVGQLLAPLFILCSLIWLALLIASLSMTSEVFPWLPLQQNAAAAVALALLTVPLCAIQLLVQNSIAVLFPAWVQGVANRGEHGLDVMGQRIIFMAGQLIVAAVALLPAAVAGSVLFLLTRQLLGVTPAGAFAVAAMLGILTTELWVGVRWLGARFENLDLSA
ncbi:MAG: putative ABC exporter domain-containing protein, partial [Pseudomonadota bacterium]